MNKPNDKKPHGSGAAKLSRREALRRMALMGVGVSVPFALGGCLLPEHGSDSGEEAPAGTYTSGGYTSGYYSTGGGGYSSTYRSGYYSQYCSGTGSLYYYSYRCTYHYRSYGSTYYSGA